jgi:hypothetical protein
LIAETRSGAHRLSRAVEIERVVNLSGLISIAGRYVSVGQALAGQRITLPPGRQPRPRHRRRRPGPHHPRTRSSRTTRPSARRRLAAAPPVATPGPARVQRRVSGGGVTRVAGQTLRVGSAHRNTVIGVVVHDTELHVYDHTGEPLAVIPRTTTKEVNRYKAYGWSGRNG